MQQTKRNLGFTLVELMVTIAVLAIITMMAAPSFIQIVRKNQLIGDTRNFVDLLAETRSEAIFKQDNKQTTLNGSGSFKNWSDTDKTKKVSGDSSVTFNRLGQSTATMNQCFVFQNKSDATLKAYVYVQKDGVVFYDKTATSCPT